MNASRIREVRKHLLAWYRQERRDLPWRRTNDPYRVWISEVMLQQTRVDTVIPYYQRFLDRFPTVRDLASADPSDVNAAWSGLGYYRRARLMMNAATAIVRDHEAALPADLDQLLALPGFGRYTAGAVASIAFDIAAPAVDGNVSRVLARLEAIDGDVSVGAPREQIWEAAEQLVHGDAPGDFNQALIELGAIVCAPRSPRCDVCPVSKLCRARALGKTSEIPPPKKRSKRSEVEVTALLLVDGAEIWLEKQPEKGLFADLWCLPMLEGKLEPDAITDEAARKYGLRLDSFECVAELTHVLTHRDIHMRVALASSFHWPKKKRPATSLSIAVTDLERLGLPTFTTRALAAALPIPLRNTARLPGRTTKTRAKPPASLSLWPADRA